MCRAAKTETIIATATSIRNVSIIFVGFLVRVTFVACDITVVR